MKSILIVAAGQFGSHTTTVNTCLQLKDKFKIKYLGIDEGIEYVDIEGISCIHLPQQKNGLFNRFILFKAVYKELRKSNYDLCLVNYFTFCSFLLLSKTNMVVEVFTGYISSNKFKRDFFNLLISIESRLFKNVLTTNEGMIEYLNLPNYTCLRPNGVKKVPIRLKDMETLRLLYVGTFHNRNITHTIHAFARFYREFSNLIEMNYTIIGFGSVDDVDNIISSINELGMNKHIYYEGEIRGPILDDYYKNSNIGISYIPEYECFEYQSPLKTKEYLMNGLVVIGTGTIENKKLISTVNGCIIESSEDGVYDGLKFIYENRLLYNSVNIQTEAEIYSIENIVNDILKPLIDNFLKKDSIN